MRCLVTGGAGFIGSALVRHLVLDLGAEVLTVDCLTYAGSLTSLRAVIDKPNHRFLKADIRDGRAMAEAIESFQPDRILHLAAESHVDRSITGSATFIQTNVIGTFTLLEATRHWWSGLDSAQQGAFRFLQVSTDEVYGSLDDAGLFTEETRYDPSSPYSASKAAADHLAIAWHRTYGLPVVVSNCSNNYGPYHFPEKLIPLAILNAIEGRPIPVYGTGANVRDWLYVEDHARALVMIADRGRPGEKYNIGGRNERSNLAVVRQIAEILDDRRPSGAPHGNLVRFVADRPGHDARYAIDATKSECEIGWRAEIAFDEGIGKTVDWYIANEWWWHPLRANIYDGERLGTLAQTEKG